MDIEVFDNLFEENFEGKKVPFLKSKGFIIAAVIVAAIALYMLFTRRGSAEDSSEVSGVAYYRGQTATGTSGSSGSYVNTSDILTQFREELSEMNTAYNERLESMFESITTTIEDLHAAEEEEEKTNKKTQSGFMGWGSSSPKNPTAEELAVERGEKTKNEIVVYYPDYDEAVDYNHNFTEEQRSTLQMMAINSVRWHDTDDEELRGYYAQQNQQLGKSIGATFDSASGKWYAKDGERLYSVSVDGKWVAED